MTMRTYTIFGHRVSRGRDQILKQVLHNPAIVRGARLECYLRGLCGDELGEYEKFSSWAKQCYRAGKIKRNYVIKFATDVNAFEKLLYDEIRLLKDVEPVKIWKERVSGRQINRRDFDSKDSEKE